MLLVDPRIGSSDLYVSLKRLGKNHNIPVEMSKKEMDAGDFCFEGHGPDGRCLIGVERKKVRDMITCIRNGRFAGHQLPLMEQMYQFQYLIIEGLYRPSADGLIEEPVGTPGKKYWQPISINGSRHMYIELAGALFTLEQMTNLHIHYAPTSDTTVQHLLTLYRWWNGKKWDRYTSHRVQHATHVEIMGKWPLRRRVATELYKIGIDKSKWHRPFSFNRAMLMATEHEWLNEGMGRHITKHYQGDKQ